MVVDRVDVSLQHSFEAIPGLKVVADELSLEEVAASTMESGHPCKLIIKPDCAEQLTDIVRVCNERGAALYPISAGKNWGLGSRRAPSSNSVLLDLSNINRILQFDTNTGVVRVEAGVSFLEISEYLKTKGDRWQCSVIGGPARASAIANALEKGDGIGAHGHRSQYLHNLQVILGSGEWVHTGHESFKGLSLDWHNSPAGPETKGLFLQSNFGIVVAADIQLVAKAVETQFILAELTDSENWQQFVSATRALIQEHLIDPRSITLWNNAKRLARQKTKAECSTKELENGSLRTWAATFFIQSFHENMMAAKLSQANNLLGEYVKQLQTFSDLNDLGEQVPSQATGVPDDSNLGSLYWEKESFPVADANPDRDGCGSVWICVAAPLNAAKLLSVTKILEDTAIQFGFSPNVGAQVVSLNAVHLFLALNYDRETPGRDEEALKCQQATIERIIQEGFPLIRLGVQSMNWMNRLSQSQRDWLQSLKTACDPNNIIAPGRYLN